MTSIGDSAFAYSKNLTRIDIPSSVKTIQQEAFNECAALKDIYYQGSESKWKAITIDENASIPTDVTMHYNSYTPEEPSAITKLMLVCPDEDRYLSVNEKFKCLGFVVPTELMSTTKLNWQSSDPNIATVDEKGIVTGVNPGEAQITVSTDDNKFSDSITMKVESEVNMHYAYDNGKSQDIHLDHTFDYYLDNVPAATYNEDLALVAAGLCQTTYFQESSNESVEAFQGLRLKNIETYGYGLKLTDSYTPAMTIGQKIVNDKKIIVVSVRGTSNATDAMIDINFSEEKDTHQHTGFANASIRAIANIKAYLEKYLDNSQLSDNDIEYYFTGHSLGAAIADITAYRMMKSGVSPSNIRSYNIATPNTVKVGYQALAPKETVYDNIFNIMNITDPVPRVPYDFISNVQTMLKIQKDPAKISYWGHFGRNMYFSNNWFSPGSYALNVDTHACRPYYIDYLKKKPKETEFLDEKQAADNYQSIYLPSLLTQPFESERNFLGLIVTEIHCPVDVSVLDPKGKVVASVRNGKEENSSDLSAYIETDGDSKYVVLNDPTYKIHLEGTDTGTMNILVHQYDKNKNAYVETNSYQNVQLEKGKRFALDDENSQDGTMLDTLHVTDNNYIPTALVQQNGEEIPQNNQGTKGEILPPAPQPDPAPVGTKATIGKITYQVTGLASAKLVKNTNKKTKKISVPSTVNINGKTLPVTEIGNNAFKNNKKLTSVVIGPNVTKIGKNVFKGCKSLKKITVKTKKLNSTSIKNLAKSVKFRGAKLTVKVPKAKKKAYKKIFKKSAKKVKIK